RDGLRHAARQGRGDRRGTAPDRHKPPALPARDRPGRHRRLDRPARALTQTVTQHPFRTNRETVTMEHLQSVTQSAIDAVKKAILDGGSEYAPSGVRKDVTTATGLVAYNLEPAARVLVPAFSPLRNRIPRVANTQGGTAVNWKVIQSLDINTAAIFVAEASKAGTITYSVTDKAAAFKTIALGDNVSFKSQWAGKTFEDVKAR